MYTDVYVALDYPSKETHWEGYNKIREYLKGEFPEFASFNVIARETNYGSARNMRELRNDILKKYDRFIRTDDDCEFSPNFIEYMDKALDNRQTETQRLDPQAKWSVVKTSLIVIFLYFFDA